MAKDANTRVTEMIGALSVQCAVLQARLDEAHETIDDLRKQLEAAKADAAERPL